MADKPKRGRKPSIAQQFNNIGIPTSTEQNGSDNNINDNQINTYNKK